MPEENQIRWTGRVSRAEPGSRMTEDELIPEIFRPRAEPAEDPKGSREGQV